MRWCNRKTTRFLLLVRKGESKNPAHQINILNYFSFSIMITLTTLHRTSIHITCPLFSYGFTKCLNGGGKQGSLPQTRSFLSLSIYLSPSFSTPLSIPITVYLYVTLSSFLSQPPSIELLPFSHPSPPFLSFLSLIMD